MTTTIRVPGAILTEREHTLPLDHAHPDGPTITVFTREVADPDAPATMPYLVFLQGGPGMEATRPTSPPTGWMARALHDFRVLLLDQRGTGRSTPVGPDIPGETPERAGRVPDPLPRRFHRPRRRGHPARARDRSLERPRPELRRVHLDDLPVDRARGPARGVHHGRPGARSAARSTTSTPPRTSGSSNGTSATSSATRRTGHASARSTGASTPSRICSRPASA